ncbi:MAG: hypothetical protein BGO98_43855 [Myxococcales bacterium 68-20]|nr:MAG: hypothetical protein BGO98_43855 [Myxococcales bacterium 68-20]
MLPMPRCMMLAPSPARQRSDAELASEKRSLASILRDHGTLAVPDAVDIALDVCDEVATAHVHGIVHGDLGMHRVRTHWPRVPGQRVDLFALGEDDSAAFAFRASSAVGILIAPEQRFGGVVDIRADVWAVGAILHWMISGAAPGSEPIEEALAGAPRTLVVTIASCLAEDPAKRPQSAVELAEVIASFASSPAERFEQLAGRRATLEKAKRVRSELGDVDGVLGRLDDAALARELVAAAEPPVPAALPEIDRLISVVNRSTGTAIFEQPSSVANLVDDELDVETVLAQPRYESERSVPVPVPSPLSIAPVDLSSELLAPPEPAVEVARAPVVAPPEPSPKSKPWMTALALVGAVAAVALGVVIGMRIVESAMAREAPTPVAPAVAVAAAPAIETTAAAAPTALPAATELVAATPATTAAPAVMTPASLPDARPLTPASLPDARPITPSSLPDAKPAAIAPRAPSAKARGGVPAGFKSFEGE